jgi:two-component system cell cycle sensor histidine kinase/response regulator CckA
MGYTIAANGPRNTTALVGEDDAPVRWAACMVLEDMGLHVLEAFDGQDGLIILLEDPSIDFLFSDITMPRMDGLTMLARARVSRPNLLVLLTSGLSSPPPGEAFLRKPYRAAALRKMVTDILGW